MELCNKQHMKCLNNELNKKNSKPKAHARRGLQREDKVPPPFRDVERVPGGQDDVEEAQRGDALRGGEQVCPARVGRRQGVGHRRRRRRRRPAADVHAAAPFLLLSLSLCLLSPSQQQRPRVLLVRAVEPDVFPPEDLAQEVAPRVRV